MFSPVLKLAGSTAFSQILGVIAMPFITRIYGPDSFGVAALFSSLIGILTVVVCLRYDLAILLPRETDLAVNVLVASVLGAALTSLLIFLFVTYGGESITNFMKAYELKSHLWMVAPMVFFSGVFQALNQWILRSAQYGLMAIARITQSLITIIVQIIVGYFFITTADGLIWGMVLGAVAGSCLLCIQILSSDSRLFIKSYKSTSFLKVIRIYKKFPLLDLWGSLLGSISTQLPLLLFGIYFSQSVVGQFALANRLIYLPMSLIGGAIGQVFFQRSADKNISENELADLTLITFKKLVTLALVPSLMFAIIGEKLFVLIFGLNWAEAGRFAAILSPWMFFWFVASPLTTIFTVKLKQENGFVVHIILFVTRVIPLVIGGVFDSPYLALILYSVFGVVAYAIVGMWSMRLAGVNYSEPAIFLGKAAMRSLPSVILVVILEILLEAPMWLVLSAVFISILEYARNFVRTDHEISMLFSAILGFGTKKK